MYQDVCVGDRLALYYEDGERGWWDATVLEKMTALNTVKLQFLLGGFKETVVLSEWHWRRYHDIPNGQMADKPNNVLVAQASKNGGVMAMST